MVVFGITWRTIMDISIPIKQLTDALTALRVDHSLTEDELRAECEHAIDGVILDNPIPLLGEMK